MSWSSLIRSHQRPVTEASPAGDRKPQHQHPLPALRAPAVSIHETPGSLVIVADMPGVTQEHLDITIEQDVVTVRGGVAPDQQDGFQPVYREYESIGFERSFTLPAEIDREQIDASVKDGVLILTLPKHKSVQPRRIAVKAG